MKPPNFKMTELGTIPEDWEVKRLGEIFTFKNGYNANANSYGSGTPVASVLDALGNRPITFQSIGLMVRAPDKDREAFSLKAGDLVFTRSSETLEDVGRSNVYLDEANALFGGFVIRGRPFVAIDSLFVNYMLSTSSCRIRVMSHGAGAQHFNIGQSGLEQVLIPLPPLAEQRRIARALSDVDELISALGKLIEKKRNIKTGTMQQLLTGKRRLPGFGGTKFKQTDLGPIPEDWEVKRLEEVANILDNRRIPLNDSQRKRGIYPYCGANGIVDYIDRYEFDEETVLIAEDGGNFADFATRPIAYRMAGRYWVNNHAHVLTAKPCCDLHYLFSHLAHKDITDVVSGGTRAKLTRGQLESLIIPLPPLSEQRAIAAVLSDMDAEIAALEAEQAKYARIKSGMMQQLLTGKTRLFFDSEKKGLK